MGWLGLTRGLPGCKALGTVLFNRVLVMGGTGRPTLLLRQAPGYGDFSGSPSHSAQRSAALSSGAQGRALSSVPVSTKPLYLLLCQMPSPEKFEIPDQNLA